MLPQTLDEQRRDGELYEESGDDNSVSPGAGRRRLLYQTAQVRISTLLGFILTRTCLNIAFAQGGNWPVDCIDVSARSLAHPQMWPFHIVGGRSTHEAPPLLFAQTHRARGSQISPHCCPTGNIFPGKPKPKRKNGKNCC